MKIIVNCETGEIKERELNKKELEVQAKYNEQSLAEKAEAQAKATARAAIADRLGLTADELKLLLG
jgi:inosine/xanthosine triphosphate pyrophosphatase family protein